MGSLILRTATRYMMLLLLLFSFFLLIRGHNEPGGGFVGGLIAASAFCLYAIAYDAASARRILRVNPVILIGFGLSLAAGSGLTSMAVGKPFMTATWGMTQIRGMGELKIGTPFLFDTGVYLVVLGVTILVVLSLAEEWDGD